MKKFEAKSLEEAYELAKNEYECSITNLYIDVIQQPSKGFLGFGKRTAIIMVEPKQEYKQESKRKETKYRKNSINIEEVSKKIAQNCQDENSEECLKAKKELESYKATVKVEQKDTIFDNFYTHNKNSEDKNLKIFIKKDQEEIITEITKEVNSLFEETCFALDEIKVSFYDNETIYMEFTGNDSALLIGKEGYRYKALSYILFNWINEKYGLMLRLEIAEFLKNQEDAIHNYLEPVIENIKENGSYKTKPLDGILVHIALKRLREEFPNKYVAVKTNQKGEKYVLVNEYRAK
ncbi:MAG: Jag N-terminal domain-containing protein [Arcobacteraceae bacterium]